MYDYLVVGAGLFGSTFARLATDAGKKCLIIDKRDHIAGNCYTEKTHGIHKHVFGPHISTAMMKLFGILLIVLLSLIIL